MNQIELQQLVERVSLEYFSKAFKHQATFNSRLKTTGGRYHLSSHNLDFNLQVLETFGMTEFLGVIKHELCHYHLHLEGRGYQHKDAEFKNLLLAVGGSRFVQSLRKNESKKAYWVYYCQHCQSKLYRQRRFDINKYVCGSCKGRLTLLEKRVEIRC
ncbi:SprT family protein [Carnobacterium gallinarum]|uniref:SprT family protein n=1 Tax=Carnobacterium gallinarum TaxID=2749 RepID=UPI00055005A3|nr:SprT family protein [Carnobacterium gallinarum]